jgi:RES domain-containing protein
MQAWRIAHRAFPIMDGGGSARHPGRWNGPNQRAIYCGGSFAITLLERLCYAALGRVPNTDVCVEIDVPDALVEHFEPAADPRWERPRSAVAKAFGARWFASRRSAALVVPSAVARRDRNVVINPEHPDFTRVTWSAPEAIFWDHRLFQR